MNQYILVEIGQKLRKIRKEKGLTVQTVASRAGVSKGLISRIENSRTVPSLPVLIAIIKGLEIGLNAFFGDIDRNTFEEVIVRKGGDLEKANENSSDSLSCYPIIDKNVPESLVKTAIFELKPGGRGEHLTTNGFTFQYLLEGQINCQIRDESYALESGDSLYFDARQIHSFENIGTTTSRMLVVSFII